MKVEITPEQKQQIKQSAQNLILAIDGGLPAKAITLSAARISTVISEAVKTSRRLAPQVRQ